MAGHYNVGEGRLPNVSVNSHSGKQMPDAVRCCSGQMQTTARGIWPQLQRATSKQVTLTDSVDFRSYLMRCFGESHPNIWRDKDSFLGSPIVYTTVCVTAVATTSMACDAVHVDIQEGLNQAMYDACWRKRAEEIVDSIIANIVTIGGSLV